jgi:hypothetical protein
MVGALPSQDLLGIGVAGALVAYAAWDLWRRRGPAWPFRLGFLTLILSIFVSYLTTALAVQNPAWSHRRRVLELPLLAVSLVFIAWAAATGRTPSHERRSGGT